MAYKVFPDSAAAKGEKDGHEKASRRGDGAGLPHEGRALVAGIQPPLRASAFLMIVIDQPHDLSADGARRRSSPMSTAISTPRARAAWRAARPADPGFAAALAEQRQGRNAIVTAAESTGAPLRAPRRRVEGLAAPKGRRHGDRRPSARTRLGGLRWPGAGLVAGAVAVVLAVIVLSGGGPGSTTWPPPPSARRPRRSRACRRTPSS